MSKKRDEFFKVFTCLPVRSIALMFHKMFLQEGIASCQCLKTKKISFDNHIHIRIEFTVKSLINSYFNCLENMTWISHLFYFYNIYIYVNIFFLYFTITKKT